MNNAAGTGLILLMVGWILGPTWSPPAQGFAEDVCPASAGAVGWGQCSLQICQPGTDALPCGSIAMLTTAASQTLRGDGARNTVHFDSTYYLAQAAGLSARDAYLVAAYDQALDPPSLDYQHRDQNGVLMADPADCGSAVPPPACVLNTLQVGGLNRNNFERGGLFFHFMAPFLDERDVDGMAPDLDDPRQELQLSHIRRWVYGGSPLCVAGLTIPANGSDYAHGDQCYRSSVRSSSELLGRIPFVSQLGFLTYVDWLSPLGEQGIITDPISGEITPASMLDRYFPPEQLPLVRLGIYMHALQDRISHERCNVASNIDGPRPADAPPILTNPLIYPLYQAFIGLNPTELLSLLQPQILVDPEFFYRFSTQDCDQPSHATRHTWETGVVQASLAPEDRTTEPALSYTLKELQHFRGYYLLPAPKASPAGDSTQFLAELLSKLESPSAAGRIASFCELAEHWGLVPLPGHCGLDFEAWNAKAGPYSLGVADAPPPAGEPSGGSGGGAFLAPWLSLFAVPFAVWRRRHR